MHGRFVLRLLSPPKPSRVTLSLPKTPGKQRAYGSEPPTSSGVAQVGALGNSYIADRDWQVRSFSGSRTYAQSLQPHTSHREEFVSFQSQSVGRCSVPKPDKSRSARNPKLIPNPPDTY